jgi:hypothetical protein
VVEYVSTFLFNFMEKHAWSIFILSELSLQREIQTSLSTMMLLWFRFPLNVNEIYNFD